MAFEVSEQKGSRHMKACLYLIPNFISDFSGREIFDPRMPKAVRDIQVFFVENEGAAKRFLKRLCPELDWEAREFHIYDEHSLWKDIQKVSQNSPGKNMGLISESGSPAVADPGKELVSWAHRNGVQVVPLIGPCSIVLALMASGLNGQNFAFSGYLPKEREQRLRKIKMLEQRSLVEQQTQIIMDTPYRNQKLFCELVETCQTQTRLCVALDLTGTEESVKTQTVSEWRKKDVVLPKKPALFLLSREA